MYLVLMRLCSRTSNGLYPSASEKGACRKDCSMRLAPVQLESCL